MRVFIGSSTEAKRLVEWLTKFIRDEYPGKIEPVPWTMYWQGGYTTLEHLEKIAAETDAAILFFTADDKTWYRNTERHEPRDNLIFEAGLFFASHGRFRTQILVPDYKESAEKKAVGIPSDLASLTLNYFPWAEGDLAATGLPGTARNVCERLAKLGVRSRPPTRLGVLAAHPDIKEILTFVGDFRTILNDGVIRLAQDPAVKEVDVLVAYRMGEVARNLHAMCNRPGVQIRVCFADMWDTALVAAYRRKYFDREAPYIQEAIKDSIQRLLGPCAFNSNEAGALHSIMPNQQPEAHFEIVLTSQRITYSFYRIDDTCFIIPLDMKLSQDPPPLAWSFSQETSRGTYEQYVGEFTTMFGEARRIF
jgi:CAP12/Pycsar effector protein, TIR domain